MNYEQKYKEALERAKAVRDHYMSLIPSSILIKDLDNIFPELKESEDERIRKELIERFNWELKGAEEQDSAGCNRQKDIAMFKRGIAWLEKQGEQKPAAWSEEDEKFVVDTMNFLYRAKNQYAQTARLEECIDWLKSIKPSHWKPSEYDISLLEEIARNIRNNVRPFCSEVSALEDLIKNLKNL